MALISTYSEYQEQSASEKVSLVKINGSYRALGWSLYSGSIYSIPCSYQVIDSIEQDGVELIAVSNIGSVTAGKYFLDRSAGTLYLRTSDSANPNGKFIAVTVVLFFSNVPVRAAHDLSSGFDVEWLPYLRSTSQFGVEIDNYNQFGFAIEGSGSIRLQNTISPNDENRDSFWMSRFDKLTFENQNALIYSWSKLLPISEAKLIYSGRIQKKSWSQEEISFDLKDSLSEIRSKLSLPLLSSLSGARIPAKLDQVPQRLIYGRVFGVKGVSYDQVVGGYPFTGTVSTTNGSAIISGSGTSFLSECSPNDQVFIGVQAKHTIQSIDSNTQITLTQAYSGLTDVGQTLSLKPVLPRRNINRKFSISGHALREPSTTITTIYNDTKFNVASAQDLIVGDQVIIASQSKTIREIYGNDITLTAPLNSPPSIGDTVLRPAISNVYLNDRLLTRTNDYTYDVSNGTLLLNSLAEFNVAPTLFVTGTVTFTSGLTSVSGAGTFFKKELKSGDWIRASTQNDFFEVLSVNSDTSITLRTSATYSAATSARMKSPDYYEEGKVTLSCDVLGATDDGTSSGNLLEKCGDIVLDLLDRAGLSDFAATGTFENANEENEAILGFVIPSKVDSKDIPSHRDVINLVNKSVFGSLVQNEDFDLEYHILLPKKASVTSIDKIDVVKFSVDSSSDKIIKTAKVNYRSVEYDIDSSDGSVSQAIATSDTGQYLSKTENTFEIDTQLIDDDAAQIYANRWAFILGIGTSVIKLETKLKAARLQATDKVELQHEKLYERFASTDNRRIGAVKYLKQNAFSVSIEVEDIGNSFSRSATITENTASDFDNSTPDEIAYQGYITDSYGMQNNDSETAGSNLIW